MSEAINLHHSHKIVVSKESLKLAEKQLNESKTITFDEVSANSISLLDHYMTEFESSSYHNLMNMADSGSIPYPASLEILEAYSFLERNVWSKV